MRYIVKIVLTGVLAFFALNLIISSFQEPLNTIETARSSNRNSVELIKLNVRLAWQANANSAGQIAALNLGFYREEGLEVTFREGGLIDPSVKTVAAGVDDLGFANGPELVIAARAAGAPLKILAVIHQQGYHAFFIREDSGIRTPEDWTGRRVGIKVGSPTYVYYQMILNKLNINTAGIQEIPLGYDIRPFLANEIDVLPGAINNEAVTLEAQGIRLKHISPEDYGIPTMGNVLFTSETMLQQHEDVVRRFLRATMRGWEWCRDSENLDIAVDYLITYNPKLDRAKERRALEETLLLIGNGSIDKDKLSTIIENQLNYGKLPRKITVDEISSPLITNPQKRQ